MRVLPRAESNDCHSAAASVSAKGSSPRMRGRCQIESSLHVCVCMYVCMCAFVCMCACSCLCVCICMYVCIFVGMSVCLYACMFVCMYVCMFVCMYAYMHICVLERISRTTSTTLPNRIRLGPKVPS